MNPGNGEYERRPMIINRRIVLQPKSAKKIPLHKEGGFAEIREL